MAGICIEAIADNAESGSELLGLQLARLYTKRRVHGRPFMRTPTTSTAQERQSSWGYRLSEREIALIVIPVGAGHAAYRNHAIGKARQLR